MPEPAATSGWRRMVVVVTAVAGVAAVGVGAIHHLSGPCSSTELARAMDALEQSSDRAAFLELDDPMRQALVDACSDAPLVGLPEWVEIELGNVFVGEPGLDSNPRQLMPPAVADELCAHAHAKPTPPPLTPWDTNRSLFERCDFARFGLYTAEESARMWIPPLPFWAAFAEVLDAGVEEAVARRYFRTLAQVFDRQARAPDVLIVEPTALRIVDRGGDPYAPEDQLFEIGEDGYMAATALFTHTYGFFANSGDFSDLPLPTSAFNYGKIVRVSLHPRVQALQLRWLVQIWDRVPEAREFWLMLADFDLERARPTVVTVRYADRHQWRRTTPPAEPGDVCVWFLREGWALTEGPQLNKPPTGALRDWADLEVGIGEFVDGLDATSELVVVLDADLETREFLPKLERIDALMGPSNHPWLRLPPKPRPVDPSTR